MQDLKPEEIEKMFDAVIHVIANKHSISLSRGYRIMGEYCELKADQLEEEDKENLAHKISRQLAEMPF